jgi:hypothetical protein
LFAIGPISDYRYGNSQAGIETARLALADAKRNARYKKHVDLPAPDRCEHVAADLISVNKIAPISSPDTIAPGLLGDFRICIQRRIMGLLSKGELASANLLRFSDFSRPTNRGTDGIRKQQPGRGRPKKRSNSCHSAPGALLTCAQAKADAANL